MNSIHSANSRARRRILLVDDNVNGLAARKTVLEEAGYKIATCSSIAAALEQFASHKFDLVVTDYKLPGIDGIALIDGLHRQAPDLPVILISGYVDTLGLNEATTGAAAVIQKSAHEVSHLIRSVNRLLRRKPAAKKPAVPAGSVKAKHNTA